MIIKDNGIILRVIPFSEQDAILTIYTQHAGKKSFFVKNGLSLKSRKRAIMSEGFWVEFIYYQRNTRELQKLTDLHLFKIFPSLISNYIKNCTLMCVVEIFREVVLEIEIPDKNLFKLLTTTIIALDKEESLYPIWWDYHLELLRLIGFGEQVNEPTISYRLTSCHDFIQQSYAMYQKFSQNVENFKIPKSFEVLKEMLVASNKNVYSL